MAVKSAERVFRIFELLEQSPEGLTNKEVSSLLGFAPSSTLYTVQDLEKHFLRFFRKKKALRLLTALN